MGSGKSWSTHENGALATAWVAAWRALGDGKETNTRSFVRNVYMRFISTPPQPHCGPGRYGARSEEALRQHFKDLAADVRRAGNVQPAANSPISEAWAILRTVPKFSYHHPADSASPERPSLNGSEDGGMRKRMRTDDVPPLAPAPTRQSDTQPAGTLAPAPVRMPLAPAPAPAPQASVLVPLAPTHTAPQAPTHTAPQAPIAPAPMRRNDFNPGPAMSAPVWRDQQMPRATSIAPVTPAEVPAATAESLARLAVNLAASLEDALRGMTAAMNSLADAQSERNALMVFSERECIDNEQSRRQRNEYLSTMRRIYLHKARMRERELTAPRIEAVREDGCMSDATRRQGGVAHTNNGSMRNAVILERQEQ